MLARSIGSLYGAAGWVGNPAKNPAHLLTQLNSSGYTLLSIIWNVCLMLQKSLLSFYLDNIYRTDSSDSSSLGLGSAADGGAALFLRNTLCLMK